MRRSHKGAGSGVNPVGSKHTLPLGDSKVHQLGRTLPGLPAVYALLI